MYVCVHLFVCVCACACACVMCAVLGAFVDQRVDTAYRKLLFTSEIMIAVQGASLINGSTAYLKIDDWRWLDPDERQVCRV
jgi:hypothetical protein